MRAAFQINLDKITLHALTHGYTPGEVASEYERRAAEMRKRASVYARLQPPPPRKQITIVDVQAEVAAWSDTRIPELAGTNRSERYAAPRRLAMYLARLLAKASYPALGMAFHKDHTTVMSACRKVEKLLLFDAETQQAVEELTRRILRPYTPPTEAAEMVQSHLRLVPATEVA